MRSLNQLCLPPKNMRLVKIVFSIVDFTAVSTINEHSGIVAAHTFSEDTERHHPWRLSWFSWFSEGEETFGSNRYIISWDDIMDEDDKLSPEIWHFWVGRIKGPIHVQYSQNAEWCIWPDESSKIGVFVIVFADYPGNATWFSLGQQQRHRLIIAGDLRPSWARCGSPLCQCWPGSKHAELAKISALRVCLART